MEPELVENIRRVADSITVSVRPERIILFNQKTGIGGRLISFKLCVVVDTQDKPDIERSIYLGIESDIPYDVLIYTPSEWQALLHKPHSFARNINETGYVVYE